MNLLNKHIKSTDKQMNDPNNRTYLDMKMWDKNIGKTFYQTHPQDKNQYRTVYIMWNAFVNAPRPMISNFITGTPPDGMEPINPLYFSKLNRVPQYSPF